MRILATNKGGASNYITVTISAACDTTILVNQADLATYLMGPLTISDTATTSGTTFHSKLVTANTVCPITAYALKKSDGTDWTDTARISVASAAVNSVLQPTLTVNTNIEFSQAVRLVATNKGGSTNYVTITISAACSTAIVVNRVQAAYTLANSLSISNTAVTNTQIHS